MELKNLTQDELEIMSNADIAYYIIKEKSSMTTANLFKKICELLELDDDNFANGIGDFYTSLTTDKRFVLLESNEWDLRDNHSVKIVMEDEDEEDEEETENVEEEIEEELEEDIDDEIIDDDLDTDDDLGDLSIVDEDDELNED